MAPEAHLVLLFLGSSLALDDRTPFCWLPQALVVLPIPREIEVKRTSAESGSALRGLKQREDRLSARCLSAR